MSIAALITWLITALGGFYLLGSWVSSGGVAQQRNGTSRLRAPLIFGHFLLAAIGLVVWIIYLIASTAALAWTAFIILLPVALLGFTMFFRWIGVYRSPAAASPGPGTMATTASTGPGTMANTASTVPAERSFPVPIVLLHGALAATTLVLVLLAAIAA